MKTIAIIFLAALFCCACSLNGVDESTVVLHDNSTIIDVRTEKEYKAGHLKNTLHIPYDTIQSVIKRHVPDKNAEIILYCRSGRRSGIAKETLAAMGYTNVINAGAYKKLKKQETENK